MPDRADNQHCAAALQLAKRRFELAKWILTSAEKIRTMKEGFVVDAGTNTHLFAYPQGLCTYLLLTCFDILGQKDSHVDYLAWLKSSAGQRLCDLAIEQLSNDLTHVEIAEQLYKLYLSEHGVKTAFYRFIDEILSDAERSDLLDCILITRIWSDKRQRIRFDAEKKKRFLYQIRNDFTHRGKPTAELSSVLGGYDVRIRKGKVHWGHSFIGTEKKTDGEVEYRLTKWPIVLFEILAPRLNLTFRDLSFEVSVIIENRSGSGTPFQFIAGLQYRDLEDPERLIELARRSEADR